MRTTRRRGRARGGFRIIDGLIAIAVTSVGLLWARDGWGRTIASIPNWSWSYIPSRVAWFGGDPLYSSARRLLLTVIYVGTTLAAPWGIALLILHRVRSPGSPSWRARRPGAVACLASTMMLGLVLASEALRPSRNKPHILIGPSAEARVVASFPPHDDSTGWRENIDPFLNTALRMPRLAGFVVSGAWIALALARRWRPERSWVDRLGRAIGVFWIAAALHFLFLPL